MKAFVVAGLALGVGFGAAFAQDVPAGFEEVGRFETVVGGSPETFVAAREVATGRSYISVLRTSGFTSLNVAGKSIAPGAGARIISVLIGPYQGDIPSEATFEIYDGPNIWAANSDTGLKVELSEVSLDGDGGLTFSFAGEAVPAERDINEGTLVPIEGGSPISVSGSFSGRLPDTE